VAIYAKDSSDMKTNCIDQLAALTKANGAISGGMPGGAFLQTTAASVVPRLAVDTDISAVV